VRVQEFFLTQAGSNEITRPKVSLCFLGGKFRVIEPARHQIWVMLGSELQNIRRQLARFLLSEQLRRVSWE